MNFETSNYRKLELPSTHICPKLQVIHLSFFLSNSKRLSIFLHCVTSEYDLRTDKFIQSVLLRDEIVYHERTSILLVLNQHCIAEFGSLDLL